MPTFICNALVEDGLTNVLVEDNLISALGPELQAPVGVPVFDAKGMVMWPGMVNTHHHLAQSMLKGLPVGINSDLNDWLPSVPFAAWPHITPETLYLAALIGFSELLRSGCTTCADHHYLYQEGTSLELESALLQAAQEVGIRFVLCRGGATTSGSHLGLQQAGIKNESLDTWLTRMEDTYTQIHDSSENAMSRLVVAPTSFVHGVTSNDLVQLRKFARAHNLRMHSHLLEVARDEEVAQSREGKSAVEYAESVDWVGDDVWFAHLVKADPPAVSRLARSKTGIAHCPVSNCRLGSGVALVPDMAREGMSISIGVDGSASAESGSMINEIMLTWLVHRATQGSTATTLSQVLAWATEGGADVLGLNTGRIEPGACADLAFYDIDEPRFFGVWQPYYAPLMCGEPVSAKQVMINGRWVVRDEMAMGVNVDDLRVRALAERQRLQDILG